MEARTTTPCMEAFDYGDLSVRIFRTSGYFVLAITKISSPVATTPPRYLIECSYSHTFPTISVAGLEDRNLVCKDICIGDFVTKYVATHAKEHSATIEKFLELLEENFDLSAVINDIRAFLNITLSKDQKALLNIHLDAMFAEVSQFAPEKAHALLTDITASMFYNGVSYIQDVEYNKRAYRLINALFNYTNTSLDQSKNPEKFEYRKIIHEGGLLILMNHDANVVSAVRSYLRSRINAYLDFVEKLLRSHEGLVSEWKRRSKQLHHVNSKLCLFSNKALAELVCLPTKANFEYFYAEFFRSEAAGLNVHQVKVYEDLKWRGLTLDMLKAFRSSKTPFLSQHASALKRLSMQGKNLEECLRDIQGKSTQEANNLGQNEFTQEAIRSLRKLTL